MLSTLTSTQIGKVGETIVGAQLMLASTGRLSPFLPIADDGGIDLVVHDKVTGRSLTIQVKGRVAKEEDTLGYTQFDVRTATFREDAGMFLLAVLLDLGKGGDPTRMAHPHGRTGSRVHARGGKAHHHSQPEPRFQGSLYALPLPRHGRRRHTPDRPLRRRTPPSDTAGLKNSERQT